MSDTLSAVAGAIPVVGSVVSGILNNAATNRANRENREFAEQQQVKQNAFNLDMWNKQNDYNAPAAQMRRYVDAGLNPNLIYGNGASSTGNVAAPVRSAPAEYVARPRSVPDFGASAAAGLSAYNNLKLGQAQANNLQAQSTVSTNDAILKSIQALLMVPQAQSTMALQSSQAALANTESSVKSMLAPYQAQSLEAEVERAKADTRFKIDENIRQAAQQSMNFKEAFARIVKMSVDNARTAAETDNIRKMGDQILNSTFLQDMDIKMRSNGIMPHDNVFMRGLAGMANWFFDQVGVRNPASTGGNDRNVVPSVRSFDWRKTIPTNW